MRFVYKIVGVEEWREAAARGSFRGSAVDLSDGYMHFSTAEQVPETAARHFLGRPDLLLAAVDIDKLGEALRWEPSRGGALFPHLYAALPLDQVVWSKRFSSRRADEIGGLIAGDVHDAPRDCAP